MRKKFLLAGSVFAGLAVILGAFGAHAFKETLITFSKESTYDTAVRYHMFHSLAILIIGVIVKENHTSLPRLINTLFSFGIIFFSGSLYLLSLTNYTLLGAITPIGGLCFVGGWAITIYYLIKNY